MGIVLKKYGRTNTNTETNLEVINKDIIHENMDNIRDKIQLMKIDIHSIEDNHTAYHEDGNLKVILLNISEHLFHPQS